MTASGGDDEAMEQRDSVRSDWQQAKRRVEVSEQDMDRIWNPLLVASGYLQLLKRRLQRQQTIDHEEMLRSLERIERALKDVQSRVGSLHEEAHRHGPDDEQRQ